MSHISSDDTQVGKLTGYDYLTRILQAPVYDTAVVTPLDSLKKLSARCNNHILLKREDKQPVFSFKLRGAYNKIAQLSDQQLAAGVVAASAGNHAQGVALSASARNVKSVIVMPRTTPDIKVDSVKQLGGIVVLHGDNFDQAYLHAKELSKTDGMTLIPPFDDCDVIAGQGTVAMELLQQQRQMDAVFVPVGGGGLIAGMAVYLKMLRPEIKIIGVESEDSACLTAALAAGEPVDLERVGLFADGVAVKRIGIEPFRLAQQYVDDMVTVSSDEICAAVKDIFEDTRAIAEPSGALAIAGLKKYKKQHQLEDQHLVAILSGANVNFHGLRYVSERCELGEQKEGIMAVNIPERKGSFRQFCQLLGGRSITEFNYRYANKHSANIFVGLRLANGETELQSMIAQLKQHDYPAQDLSHNEIAKLHVRYMVGGRPCESLTERLFSFEFPECPGALSTFLETLGENWNITLFHYRNHGAAFGRVLAGFELSEQQLPQFLEHLGQLGYQYKDETDNLAYTAFLTH
ncbi:threonine ammonia-lyase, biosynthetic [Psychrobium sp. 1_MG-2023]|uniref:threonine ammonia-lyase, biosynthetic n=1 Tax=Psychrobium sp. 1_MG-2023 TaxID=3062624 RepID=UPI000C324AC4|nr:threonine ammonia-lyase, biosynthetic [Psychrobium sp. 1_MG-2023]MDP2562618.1 threonine ammonia-lyase, biosynthetic [Psychrobium sp. 1_MG-2023]PKF54375.1 threonine ammonia-lyase, biosynthetic [Alteromonadales bacterium alter-6D02]